MAKSERKHIGLVGLGNMGQGVAENLIKHQFPLTVFARSKRVEQWAAGRKGVIVTRSLKELAGRSEVILLSVTDGKAVQDVLFREEGIMAGVRSGTIIVDMTTSDPTLVKETYRRLEAKGISQLDAPMSGGATGAREGKMILMVGGKKGPLTQCESIFFAIATKVVHAGGPGSGQHVKLLQNQLSFTLFLATCEAIWMGKSLGFDPAMLIDVFQHSNARSYETEFRFPQFVIPGKFKSGAAIKIAMKDLRLARNVRQGAQVTLPLADDTFRYWKRAIEEIGGDEDFTRVFHLVKAKVDLKLLADKVQSQDDQ